MTNSNDKPLSKKIMFGVISLIIIIVGSLTIMRLFNSGQSKKIEPVVTSPTVVKVSPAKKGDIINWVFGKGIVRTTRREFLNFNYPGKVAFIDKDADGRELREGSRVRGPLPGERFGQLLARLDHREQVSNVKAQEVDLARAHEEVKSAKLAVTQAENVLELEKKSLKRTKTLQVKGVVSRQDLENSQAKFKNAQIQLKTAKAQLKSTRLQIKAALVQLNRAKLSLEKNSIFAPFDGVIAYFNISTGDYVNPDNVDKSSEQAMLESTPVVLISEESYEITLNLPAFDGKLVKRDQPAFITWGKGSLNMDSAGPSKDITSPAEGYVYAVNPVISPGGRTIQVKIRTISNVEELQDGMFVTCWIVVQEKKNTLLAPSNSLIYRQNSSYVFVYDSQEGTVTEKEIALGIEEIMEVEVLEGINDNDLLVTEGRQRLTSGMKVQLTSQTMGE